MIAWWWACAAEDSAVALPGGPRRELPEDLHAQAWDALERDAWRRENRFLEAVEPGRAFRATRAPGAALDAAYAAGGQLFEMNLATAPGFGAGDRRLRRFHVGERGGPDALGCTDCHWRGGPVGGGDAADNVYLEGDGDTQASALERNPRSLVGAGVVELLAREMSAELAAQRAALGAAARREGKALQVELVAKGVRFGSLGALPDGSFDTRRVEGVDPDLVVRPFGWKGSVATLPEVIEQELALHHGLQTDRHARSAPAARVGDGPAGDPDADGVRDEISPGQLRALTAYLALAELPQLELPTRSLDLQQWSRGEAAFRGLGCADCHLPAMVLEDPVYRAELPDGSFEADLAVEGAEPRLQRDPVDGRWRVYLFSDLRRHDLGPGLAESRPYRDIPAAHFLTPPLWGVARSRPYLHDARAPNLEEAILAHGGEARAARDAYAALSVEARYPVRIYLATMLRAARMIAP